VVKAGGLRNSFIGALASIVELLPALDIGWCNGWVLLCLLYLIFGILLVAFPKEVVLRLYEYNRSGWSKAQRASYVIGKILAVVCMVLMIFSPLKIWTNVFIPGIALYVLGLTGFIIALINFRNTPLDQPVTSGLYGISRHPQMLMLFVLASGICIAIGSWLALFIQIISSLFLRSRTLAEEKACLELYGDSYRAYMKRVPRYLLIQTRIM